MYGSASSSVAALAISSSTFSSQGSRVGDVALVELHIILGEVGRVHNGLGPAEGQVGEQLKFRTRNHPAQFPERNVAGPAPFQGEHNLLTARRPVAHVHAILDDLRG